ncbi:piggyBac transposable element-derived protein 4-like [Ixodes scapularis]|uniref:piggyBac transposable element-derived protein 4-like n=1 Tax=Ixodes scapularis TaxID=6945 RepID=UPI001C394D9B|nr:piggyBac transposable element-derived protein 4-like [Ixodes scapularis]
MCHGENAFAQTQSSSDEDEELVLDSVSDHSSDLKLSSDECDTSDDEDLQASRKWTKLDNEKLLPPPLRFPFLASPAWKLLTAQELKVFLALTLPQGIIDKPELAMYWSARRILQTPIFGELMSKNRFHLIMKFLHFSDNEDEIDESQHPQPKLRKLWLLLCLLKERFLTLYVPESTVAVDESLMLYKGRLSWKQYLPLKRSRFGVKFFLLCESESGYVSNLLVYTGEGTVTPDADSAMSTKIVLSVMEPFFCKGYCVTVDNYYTFPELRGKCMALQWRDKKLVTLLSTVHDATVVEGVNARNEKVVKPAAVYYYNNTMGGVDKNDQNLLHYPAVRDG